MMDSLAVPAVAIAPISHTKYIFQAPSFSKTIISQEAGQRLFVLRALLAVIPSTSLVWIARWSRVVQGAANRLRIVFE
jgi:hypothetical protein